MCLGDSYSTIRPNSFPSRPGSGPNLGYNTAQMIAVDTNIVRRIIGSAGLILLDGLSLCRIFKSNPGEKFIECGSITVIVFVVTIVS